MLGDTGNKRTVRIYWNAFLLFLELLQIVLHLRIKNSLLSVRKETVNVCRVGEIPTNMIICHPTIQPGKSTRVTFDKICDKVSKMKTAYLFNGAIKVYERPMNE